MLCAVLVLATCLGNAGDASGTTPSPICSKHLRRWSSGACREKVRTSMVLGRAFDKAVRRKPPVVAADAVPMQISIFLDAKPGYACAATVAGRVN